MFRLLPTLFFPKMPIVIGIRRFPSDAWLNQVSGRGAAGDVATVPSMLELYAVHSESESVLPCNRVNRDELPRSRLQTMDHLDDELDRMSSAIGFQEGLHQIAFLISLFVLAYLVVAIVTAMVDAPVSDNIGNKSN